MLMVRGVRREEHGEILGLAKLAGIGMSSLPPDEAVLEQKIARSVASFAGQPEYPQGETFLFALEDTETGKIVGTTGLIAHVGVARPFYSYKLSTIVQASETLGIYSLNRVLHMVNDYTGASEIGSLFLIPQYRRDGIGKFLSRCRHLMLAEFPHLFSDIVISEIRGVQNVKGESPFYNNLAKYFFQMDFKRTDFIYATQGGQFIADLMPRYPIYVKLLDPSAQSVIGVPLEASQPAKRMLESEGFTYEGYVDIFDGGPTMQAERAQIRTVRESKKVKVTAVEKSVNAPDFMISNTSLPYFAMVRAPLLETEAGAVISQEAANCLGLSAGGELRYAP
jgi:arginine N-succinyltransferase